MPGQHGCLARVLCGKLHHPVHHEHVRKSRILLHFCNLNDNSVADARFRTTVTRAYSLCVPSAYTSRLPYRCQQYDVSLGTIIGHLKQLVTYEMKVEFAPLFAL